MNELLAPITGKVKLQIHGKEYEFKNTVSVYFDYLQHSFLGLLGLTNEPSGSISIGDIEYFTADGFSLVEEAPSINEPIAYTELAFVPLSAFRVAKASLKETVLRASATISIPGTIRAGGFNIMSKVPKGIRLPHTTRKITLPVTTQLNLPSRWRWYYNPTVKAFYYFGESGAGEYNIYKIPFDIDTLIFGSLQIVSSNWSRYSYQLVSDGENRMFSFDSGTLLKMFDCLTDTVTNIPLSVSIPSSYWGRYSPWYWAWDDVNKVLRSPDELYFGGSIGYAQGATIDINGMVAVNTGRYILPSGDVRRFRKDFIVSSYEYCSYGSGTLGYITNFNEIGHCNRAFIQNNMFIYAEFDNLTPSYVTLYINKMPETYLSIMSVTPPIPVVPGDSFSIEYSFITGS